MRDDADRYPPIADYAMISDCHCCALISRDGSIDWCCLPRLDEDSCFGRLLDWDRGGYCAIRPAEKNFTATRCYVAQTMILETCFESPQGKARLYDFFAIDEDGLEHPRYDHVRILEGITGEMECHIQVSPRFDYGEINPHIHQDGSGAFIAFGSNKGLIIDSDADLQIVNSCDLVGTVRVRQGQRIRLVIQFQYPELIGQTIARGLPDASALDRYLEQTREWWQRWAGRIRPPFEIDEQTLRSTLVLKALTFERTGAIAAAATTSLPECVGGPRNWDYRYSWVRDSVFTVRALHELGYVSEADRFHEFIQRSAAGSADQMQIMYGVDGKRRLTEIELEWLEGYRGSRPVRIGNFAAKQRQLDIYGELLEMAWEWHASGHPTEPQYWSFLSDVIDFVCQRWQHPDHGIWEVRDTPRHYVHSKVMCWVALDRGVRLAQENGFPAPLQEWARERDNIRMSIEQDGYDGERGVFVRAYGERDMDAALLLLPRVGFCRYDDPRMVRTVDAICEELDCHGLLQRYKAHDGLPGTEGVFLPCTFWLVYNLAYQGRLEHAWQYYRRAAACVNDLGLFSEEYDALNREMLGNFPQALTHVSQIMARLALAGVQVSAG